MSEHITPPWRAGGRATGRERPVFGERLVIGERPVFGERPVIEVGDVRPGSPASQAALRRYLLVRALGRSVVSTVQWAGIAVLLVAVLCWLGGLKVLAVLVAVVALLILAVRRLLRAVEYRLSGSAGLGALEPRVAVLVSRTRRGLRREMRRVGLPGLPLLIAVRLLRPSRRAQTVQALSRIDLAGVVPPSRVDELQVLLRQAPPGRF